MFLLVNSVWCHLFECSLSLFFIFLLHNSIDTKGRNNKCRVFWMQVFKLSTSDVWKDLICPTTIDNWGIVQVLACHKEQHRAWRKKPDIEYWFSFSFFFLSHAPLEADSLAEDEMACFEVCFPTAQPPHTARLILGALQRRRWEPLKKPRCLFVKKALK